MGFTAVKCPQCGADIQLDDSREFGFCSYCGTKVMQDKVVVEHRGSVSVSGVATDTTLLNRAVMFLEDGDFESADKYLEKVLDVNPECSKAYICKLMCQLKMHTAKELLNCNKSLDKYDNFLKAKRFATAQELTKYEAMEKAVNNRLNVESKAKAQAINEKAKEIKDSESKLKKNKFKYMVSSLGSALFCMLSVIGIIFVCLGIDFLTPDKTNPENNTDLGIFTLILGLVALGISIFKLVKVGKISKAYKNNKNTQAHKQAELNSQIANYENWKVEQSKKVGSKVEKEPKQTVPVSSVRTTPLNNIRITRARPKTFGDPKVTIWIDNAPFALAQDKGTIEINLSQGTHTMQFKANNKESGIVPISINAVESYEIIFKMNYLSIGTEVRRY